MHLWADFVISEIHADRALLIIWNEAKARVHRPVVRRRNDSVRRMSRRQGFSAICHRAAKGSSAGNTTLHQWTTPGYDSHSGQHMRNRDSLSGQRVRSRDSRGNQRARSCDRVQETVARVWRIRLPRVNSNSIGRAPAQRC